MHTRANQPQLHLFLFVGGQNNMLKGNTSLTDCTQFTVQTSDFQRLASYPQQWASPLQKKSIHRRIGKDGRQQNRATRKTQMPEREQSFLNNPHKNSLHLMNEEK